MNPRHVVETAINQLQSFVEGFLAQAWTTWGPGYVHVFVWMPGFEEPMGFVMGDLEASVGGEQFYDIARRKMEAAKREQMDTRDIVALCPWRLQPGEYLYAGGVYRQGIAVGVSGVHAAIDHMIAAFIAEMIVAQCMLDRDEHIEVHDMIVS